MTFAEFDAEMKRIVDAFDKTKSFYGKARMDVIFANCSDLQAHDFRRIVTDMIMRMKDRPVPDDFSRYASHYRRSSPKGREGSVDESSLPPDCEHCKDVGFIRVRYHDDLEMKSATLMRCMCDRGTRHPNLFIPRWERGLEAAYKWASCPVDWFRPKDIKTEKGGITMESLSVVVESWKKRLSEADKFWRDLSIKETGS